MIFYRLGLRPHRFLLVRMGLQQKPLLVNVIFGLDQVFGGFAQNLTRLNVLFGGHGQSLFSFRAFLLRIGKQTVDLHLKNYRLKKQENVLKEKCNLDEFLLQHLDPDTQLANFVRLLCHLFLHRPVHTYIIYCILYILMIPNTNPGLHIVFLGNVNSALFPRRLEIASESFNFLGIFLSV